MTGGFGRVARQRCIRSAADIDSMMVLASSFRLLRRDDEAVASSGEPSNVDSMDASVQDDEAEVQSARRTKGDVSCHFAQLQVSAKHVASYPWLPQR